MQCSCLALSTYISAQATDRICVCDCQMEQAVARECRTRIRARHSSSHSCSGRRISCKALKLNSSMDRDHSYTSSLCFVTAFTLDNSAALLSLVLLQDGFSSTVTRWADQERPYLTRCSIMANHAAAIGVRLWLVRRRPAGTEALYQLAFCRIDCQHDPNEFRCR